MRDQVDEPSLAEQFRSFGRTAGRDGAHLYDRLCRSIADDDGLLGLLAGAPHAQRRPNLLLAAVHYLLLAGADHPLAAYYPTVTEWRAGPGGGAATGGAADDGAGRGPGPFADFREFCDRYGTEVAALLSTRSTQTNEVGRCAALLPALATVAAAHDLPLSLLDLGASAGLNLLFDRYAYTYRGAGPAEVRRAGDAGSPVLIEAGLRGRLPDLALPRVARRAGIDRDPVDPADADRSLWLLACQWPDHVERFHRLRDALALARSAPERVLVARGDLVDDLPSAAAAAPDRTHLCVVNTWVAAYLAPGRQAELAAAVDTVSRARPVSWVFAEHPYEVPSLPVPPAPDGRGVRGATALVLVEADQRRRRVRRLADMHPHGRWIHWWD